MRTVARKSGTSLLLAITLGACGHSTSMPSPAQSASFSPPTWSEHAAIYEINVRQYTPEGTLAALRTHLPQLDSLGVDILWVMPMQPIGKLHRKGSLGSYYSISNYTAINPEYGSAGDFLAFVSDAHKRGKHVVLDWVANHTAFDHVWITQHPDWYVHDSTGKIINARDNEGKDTDWTDVAELDYSKPAMREAMISDMRWWVDSMHIDGFRCDVAGGVPIDFWIQARQALAKSRADLFWLAEAESLEAHRAFDATYGWELHHLLNDISQGKKPTSDLDPYFARQRERYPRGAMRMYFTSNHDENSWNGSEFERMGANHLPSFVLSATAMSSIPLMYSGQEVSMRKRLRFFDRDTVEWSGASLAGFYRAMMDLKHTQPALANGAFGGAQTTLTVADRVYAFTRARDKNTVVVALNFGDAPATVAYGALAQAGSYTDWFDKSKVELKPSGSIAVPAHGYRVLVQ
ncbi:MAG TPA: alpha-amylase family glycosyl hydrolase [Gemmatimonadaceae bacterium]|jgi:glycosidase|nr:alpha-amylase family glycosyl hydrolase [Gemmatimonadaceae bacterium]